MYGNQPMPEAKAIKPPPLVVECLGVSDLRPATGETVKLWGEGDPMPT